MRWPCIHRKCWGTSNYCVFYELLSILRELSVWYPDTVNSMCCIGYQKHPGVISRKFLPKTTSGLSIWEEIVHSKTTTAILYLLVLREVNTQGKSCQQYTAWFNLLELLWKLTDLKQCWEIQTNERRTCDWSWFTLLKRRVNELEAACDYIGKYRKSKITL